MGVGGLEKVQRKRTQKYTQQETETFQFTSNIKVFDCNNLSYKNFPGERDILHTKSGSWM